MKALLIVLLILLGILLIPVGVWVYFSAEGLHLSLELGKIKIKLLPKNPDTPEQEQRKKTKKRKKKKASALKDDAKSEEKTPLGAQLPFFRQLLGTGISVLGSLKRKLTLKKLILHLNVGCKGDDPAASAILYGRGWAAVGALTPILENTFRIRNRDIQVFCDFREESTTIYAEGRISLHIGDVLWIGLRYGIPTLIALIKNKRKGGKNNGTSDK